MATLTRAAPIIQKPRPAPHASEGAAWLHLGWFAAGGIIAFALPYIFTSVLSLQHDLYYGIYFAVVLTFLTAYVRGTRVDVTALFRRAWQWSLAIGVAASVFVIANVLSRDATDGPAGAYAVFELLWRGAAYGVVDALLLTAFPGAVAFALLKEDLSTVRRHLVYAGLALPLVLLITAVYHLGYDQFRDEGVQQPEFGNTVISLPMLATANPLGSVATHAAMHVTADVHAYETDVFLPPQVEAP